MDEQEAKTLQEKKKQGTHSFFFSIFSFCLVFFLFVIMRLLVFFSFSVVLSERETKLVRKIRGGEDYPNKLCLAYS
jgi:uncharacterized membrane protein